MLLDAIRRVARGTASVLFDLGPHSERVALHEYPKWVFNPGGMYWPHPAAWRRNTLAVLIAIGIISVPILQYGIANEHLIFEPSEADVRLLSTGITDPPDGDA